MRARLPRDSGETKGGLQRRRLAGWREETFLFRVPCPLRGCTAASSFRPRPPTTNHHHNITACPPVSPPRNQTRPGVGRSKVSDSPRPRERGGRPPSIHPSSPRRRLSHTDISPDAKPRHAQTTTPRQGQGIPKGRTQERVCVRAALLQQTCPTLVMPLAGASCRLQPTTPLLQSVHQVRKESKARWHGQWP